MSIFCIFRGKLAIYPRFCSDLLAKAIKTCRKSQISYENGEIGYVEYIQNLQTALDVQLRFADAVNDYNQAVINLKFIKGEEK